MSQQKRNALEIVKYPAEILRKKALPIEKITEETFQLAEAMISTMIENDGVGLAANQVANLQRIFVVNTTPFDEKVTALVVLNPVLLEQEGSTVEEEGCLSFPKLYLKIQRPEKIRVGMQDLYNQRLVIEAEGFLARAILHEIDHLDGVLFIDYVNEAETKVLKEYLDDFLVTRVS